MDTSAPQTARSKAPAEKEIEAILNEVAVPLEVLREARKRRDLVLSVAGTHPAAREGFSSGSVAHGTENKPLEDADCGEMIDRRHLEIRVYGPDGDGRGPSLFVESFRSFIEVGVRSTYPNAVVTANGKRSIKIEFNEMIEIDEWGEVDPYVDFIVGLSMAKGDGIWIPNLESDSWDPGDPIRHTWLMTKRDPEELRVLRARVLRLAKRAVKRDAAEDGRCAVMCSWNLSALALEYFEASDDMRSLGTALRDFFAFASASIRRALTEDPSDAIPDPINLPEGVTQELASRRLAEMSDVVEEALQALSPQAARNALAAIFGPEIEVINERTTEGFATALRREDSAAAAAAIGSTYPQRGSSWSCQA